MRYVASALAAVTALLSGTRASRFRGQEVSLATGGPGFSVGTSPGASNVVSDFSVVSDWSSGNDLASGVGMDRLTTEFYLHTGSPGGTPVTITSMNIDPALNSNARNHLVGPLADRLRTMGTAVLYPGDQVALTVQYECLSPGIVSLALTVNFENLSPVFWSWTKTCGGEDNNALMVTGGEYNDKVLVQGRPRWDESQVVGTASSQTKFALFVDPLSGENQLSISTPTAIGKGACSAHVVSPITPGTVIGAGSAAAAAVHYKCNSHGPCVIEVEAPFYPNMAPYRPARWSYTKLCGGGAMGVDVEAETAGNKTYLARDGAPTHGEDGEMFVDGAINDHKLWIVNDMVRSDEPELKVQMLRVTCLDSLRCGAKLNGAVPRRLSSARATELDVSYTCLTSGSSVVQLLLEADGRDPMKIQWTKDCSVWTDSFGGTIFFAFIASLIFSCACIGTFQMCCAPPNKGYMEYEEEEEEEELEDVAAAAAAPARGDLSDEELSDS